MVANDAPQQAVVGSGDVVVVVHQQRRQRRGIDAEDGPLRHLCRQLGVQGVDALYHQHLVVVQAQTAAAHRRPARGEVVARQLNLLAAQQRVQLLVEQRQVQRVQVLEVVVAAGVARCLVAVHEIVVERDADGLHTAHQQLHAQPLARSGLAA